MCLLGITVSERRFYWMLLGGYLLMVNLPPLHAKIGTLLQKLNTNSKLNIEKKLRLQFARYTNSYLIVVTKIGMGRYPILEAGIS